MFLELFFFFEEWGLVQGISFLDTSFPWKCFLYSAGSRACKYLQGALSDLFSLCPLPWEGDEGCSEFMADRRPGWEGTASSGAYDSGLSWRHRDKMGSPRSSAHTLVSPHLAIPGSPLNAKTGCLKGTLLLCARSCISLLTSH